MMKPFIPICLVGLLAVCPPLLRAEKPASLSLVERKEMEARLPRGTTDEKVRALLGPPHRVGREIVALRHREQWVYEAPYFFRVEFDRPRGQKASLTRIWLLRTAAQPDK
jgi:hypothetical protein